MIVIFAEEKTHFPRNSFRKNDQTNNILYYINRCTEEDYFVAGIYCVGSKEQLGRRKKRRKKDGKETTQAIH